MPILDTSDETRIFGSSFPEIKAIISFAKLRALSLYIDDEAKKLDYLRNHYGRMLIEFSKASTVKLNTFKEKYDEFRELLGGEEALFESPNTNSLNKDIEIISNNAMVAGLGLYLFYLMAHAENNDNPPSINKIAYIMNKNELCSRADFFKQWEKFKSVSHIWAAILCADQFHKIRNEHQSDSKEFNLGQLQEWSSSSGCCDDPDLFWDSEIGQIIGDTFAWSVEFQNFGIHSIRQRSKGTLLNDSEIWSIPELIPWPLEPLPDISQWLIGMAKAYRAPKDLGD